jgi:chemotaxis methyl-accepting protein methylase
MLASLPDGASPSAAGIAEPSPALLILEDALAILRERRGLDFAGYRRATIERRLANRMIAARARSAEAYLQRLRETEDEIDRLAANLTVKVSRFYRNAGMFDSLREHVIPALREAFHGEPLRAWSAGCARGEEAYTLAMLLGAQDEIQGSDIDESALAAARTGIYPAEAFADAPAELLVGEFVAHPGENGLLAVTDELRRRVRFVRHDLVGEDAPPGGGRYHLICCRNVLIYFARPLQIRALRRLAGSLVSGGVLCLGEAEWPIGESSPLEVVDRRNKIFRRPVHQEATP